MIESQKELKTWCEYLENPIGIQNHHPRFAWRVQKANQFRQVAYQIKVKHYGKVLWDSKKVESDKSSGIPYEGEQLHSFETYEWIVHLWLYQKDGDYCEMEKTSSFEMGILENAEWKGEWISANDYQRHSELLVRKVFSIVQTPKKARLYISGIGYFKAWLNGKSIGDAELDPGWTNYNKTVLYRVFDVGPLLLTGTNVLAIALADGWLDHESDAFNCMVGRQLPWVSVPKVLCNLYVDKQVIASCGDGTWYCVRGPISYASIYDGEIYDANYEKVGFKTRDYILKEGEWKKAIHVSPPSGILRSQIMPPIKKIREYKPKYIDQINDDTQCRLVIGFEINLSGWVKIEAIGSQGKQITIKYGETLSQNHTVNQNNLRYAKAQDCFIFGQKHNITYHPTFVYHGFRYVEIMMDQGVVIKEVKACELHSDVKSVGTFSCSNPLLNRIQTAMRQTEVNNLYSIPTDCPQRDERMGWMNDMTVRFEEALYNYDMILFYEKWLQDIVDEQRDDGAIPDTAPYVIGRMPARHPSSAFVLIPWYLYLFYNDEQIMSRYYDNIKMYINFKLNQLNLDGLLPEKVNDSLMPNCYMGDWAPPMTEAYLGYICNAVPNGISQSFLTTSYLLYDCQIIKKMATVLQKQDDFILYDSEEEKLKKTLNSHYLNSDGSYDNNSQSSNSFPLLLQYVPKEKAKILQDHLIQAVINNDYHITTGNQMTKYLFEALNQSRYDDIAYKIAASNTYPSLGYMIEQGATTIWERWEYLTNKAMNSHDHPMLGAYTNWFYKGLAGIKVDTENVKTLILAPAIIPSLDYVRAQHEFLNGICTVSWRICDYGYYYEVTIPWNMVAKVTFQHCKILWQKISIFNHWYTNDEIEKMKFYTGSYRFILV